MPPEWSGWARIQGFIIVRRDPEDTERYWFGADSAEMLSGAFAFDRRINLGRYASLLACSQASA